MSLAEWLRRLRRCAYVASTLCVFAFLAGLVCQLVGDRAPRVASMISFPLSWPEDVVADDKGSIYVAVTFYSRVQVYDPKGRFQFGFFTDAGGGAFRLCFDSDGRLNVITARGGHVHIYDDSGKLLSSQEDPKKQLFNKVSREHTRGSVDSDGNRYVIRAALLNPQVLRYDKHGNVTLRIRTPLLLWPLIGPMPCWLVIMLIALAGVAARFWKQDHRRVSQCSGLFPSGKIRRRDVLLRTHTAKRDIILTDRALCWASSVWDPYVCIEYSDLQFQVEEEGVFMPKWTLRLQSVSEPALWIRFSTGKLDEWVNHLERYCGLPVDRRATVIDGAFNESTKASSDSIYHKTTDVDGAGKSRSRDKRRSFRLTLKGTRAERSAAAFYSVFIMGACLIFFAVSRDWFRGGHWVAKLVVDESLLGVFLLVFFALTWARRSTESSEASLRRATKRLGLTFVLIIVIGILTPIILVALNAFRR